MTTPSPTQRFFGGLLMAVGVLIMLASGLCSVAFIAMLMGEGGNANDALQLLIAVAVFGGIPFALGVGLFVGGRALRRP